MKYSLVIFNCSVDYTKQFKENSIPVGPVAWGGSLVAYCLEITDLDPIEFDLISPHF